jgi:hypothetical protein
MLAERITFPHFSVSSAITAVYPNTGPLQVASWWQDQRELRQAKSKG